jgi:uncharacterized membrane protein YciS (DUF1049 family)
MKEYLFREYELNEKYHDSKENRAWIAWALYFTYSLLLLQWILRGGSQTIIKENTLILVILICLIDLSAFLFVLFQIQRKVHSVRKSSTLKSAIADTFDQTNRAIWSTVVWKNEMAESGNLQGSHFCWIGLYKIELPLFFLMFLFWIVKVYFILTIPWAELRCMALVPWLQAAMYCGIAFGLGLSLGCLLCYAIGRRIQRKWNLAHPQVNQANEQTNRTT